MILCTALFASTANHAGFDGAFEGHPIFLAKAALVLIMSIAWVMLATLLCIWVTDHMLSMCVLAVPAAVGAAVAEMDVAEMDVAEMDVGGTRALAVLVRGG